MILTTNLETEGILLVGMNDTLAFWMGGVREGYFLDRGL